MYTSIKVKQDQFPSQIKKVLLGMFPELKISCGKKIVNIKLTRDKELNMKVISLKSTIQDHLRIIKKKRIDIEFFCRVLISIDKLTVEELKDLEYVEDRIDTHIEVQS